MNSSYRQDANVGLTTNFNLVDGKFQLVGGEAKCQDNMRMIMYFVGWFRLAVPDYPVNMVWLLQKPASYINTFKNVYLNQFIDVARKYAPNISVQKSNINYSPNGDNRRQLEIAIEYIYKIQPKETFQFIQIIQQ